MSRFARRFLPLSLRQWGLVALASSAVALTACGGGSRAKPYQPGAMVSFGDEYSAISEPVVSGSGSTAISVAGLTYSVNPVALAITGYCTDQNDTACTSGFVTDVKEPITITSTGYFMFDPVNAYNVVTRLDKGSADSNAQAGAYSAIKRTSTLTYACTSPAIWTQVVARSFGLGFQDKCSKDAAGATSYAAPGAKVADVATQVQTAIAAGKLGSGVLVTVWAGQNDIIEIFDDASVSDKVSAATQRGLQLAVTVDRILSTGAKVILVNVPDLGYSPYGVAKLTAKPKACTTASASACNGDLEVVVQAFNHALIYQGALNSYAKEGGRNLAQVNMEELMQSYAANGSYNMNNKLCNTDTVITSANVNPMRRPDGTVDATDLRYCSDLTLVPGGNVATYFWADTHQLARLGHSLAGSTAVTRASNQF